MATKLCSTTKFYTVAVTSTIVRAGNCMETRTLENRPLANCNKNVIDLLTVVPYNCSRGLAPAELLILRHNYRRTAVFSRFLGFSREDCLDRDPSRPDWGGSDPCTGPGLSTEGSRPFSHRHDRRRRPPHKGLGRRG